MQDSCQCIRFNVEKLKDTKIASIFEANAGGILSLLSLIQNDINTITYNIKKVPHEIAIEVLSKETKGIAVMGRWTEYCHDLYNYELRQDMCKLDSASYTNREHGEAPVLHDEM